MTRVQTRSKLQPFIDEGVIYKDRKIVRYKRDDEKMNHIDPEVEERIMNYKDKIQACIREGTMFELEAIINELTLSMDDNIDNLRIYERLRMNLIHGQICLAHFWRWKDESR